jgi:hypothetical protein
VNVAFTPTLIQSFIKMARVPDNNLGGLPVEVWCMIFGHMDVDTAFKTTKVSHDLRDLIFYTVDPVDKVAFNAWAAGVCTYNYFGYRSVSQGSAQTLFGISKKEIRSITRKHRYNYDLRDIAAAALKKHGSVTAATEHIRGRLQRKRELRDNKKALKKSRVAQVEAGLSSIGLQFDRANRHLFRWYIKNGTNPRWGGDCAWLLQRAQELDWFTTNTDYINHRSALPTVVNIRQNCLYDEIARNIAMRAWMACNAEADMNTLPTLVRQRRTRLQVEGTSVFNVNFRAPYGIW